MPETTVLPTTMPCSCRFLTTHSPSKKSTLHIKTSVAAFFNGVAFTFSVSTYFFLDRGGGGGGGGGDGGDERPRMI